MSKFEIILKNFPLKLRQKRTIKKVIKKTERDDKKANNSKTHVYS